MSRTEAPSRAGTVAANLKALIGGEPVNSWSVRHGLKQPTVRRILIGEISPTETKIAEIARAVGLEPWQLLVPGLTPKNPPVLREANDAERRLYERIDQALRELGALREQANTRPGMLT